MDLFKKCVSLFCATFRRFERDKVFVRGCSTVIPRWFGNPIKLTVIPEGKPQLFAISPLDPPISLLKTSEDYPDVCLASNLPPSAGMLSMNLCGGRVSHNITGTISSHNKSYHFAFSSRSMDFCEADGTYSHYRNVDVCEKVHPGNASVNSYLLIMNAVRVALTKVLAFTTLLTIKALVH
ncbi:uncharacterized protein LOC144986747 [Oryzias latipes]